VKEVTSVEQPDRFQESNQEKAYCKLQKHTNWSTVLVFDLNMEGQLILCVFKLYFLLVKEADRNQIHSCEDILKVTTSDQ
jgi:hypothetical protein